MPRMYARLAMTVAASLLYTAHTSAAEAPSQGQNWFEAFTGGHYLGDRESEAVRNLSPDQQRALLSDPATLHRAQAKGQVNQLRKRLVGIQDLTQDQVARLEEALVAVRDQHEQGLKKRYAGRPVRATARTWYGLSLIASNDSGIPVQDQFISECEAFARQQLDAAAGILTVSQLEVYRMIQDQRLATQRSLMEQLWTTPHQRSR